MKLSEKQQLFTQCIGQLIAYATEQGYGLTFGDAYRDPRNHGERGVKKSYGSANSNHKIRLAVDFNLFVNGQYISHGSHPAYKELAAFWEGLNEYTCSGIHFGDANHFSFEHQGVK